MRVISLSLLALTSAPVSAEVVSSGPNGFHIRHSAQIVVPQERAYEVFGRIGSWWDDAHTYSGAASNMSLSTNAGGCFCERLPDGGGVEHMRVAYVVPGERLVLTGSLGPLLYAATTGVMDVKFERIAGGTRVTMDYKAAGFAEGKAADLAPLVDQVLGTQMARYRQTARAAPATR